MAPHTLSPHRLARRTNLTLQGNVAIIILVILFVSGIFCTVIFFKVCSKQRRREKAMRRMQEERVPFVSDQYTAPTGAPSAQEYQQPTVQQYVYNGPVELQGVGRSERQEIGGAPLPAQQLDGYNAAPTFDDSRPIELPATAVVHGEEEKTGKMKKMFGLGR
jgi:hypothetical protein